MASHIIVQYLKYVDPVLDLAYQQGPLPGRLAGAWGDPCPQQVLAWCRPRLYSQLAPVAQLAACA